MSPLILTVICLASITPATHEEHLYPKPIFVPPSKRSWEIDFPGYDPPEFTKSCEGECDPPSPRDIKFNKISNGIDRRRVKACHRRRKYAVDAYNYPANPAGRTGIRGRGALPRWGPNHMLQVMLVWTTEDGKWVFMKQSREKIIFPWGFVDSATGRWFDVETEKRIEVFLSAGAKSRKDVNETIAKAKLTSKLFASGSIPFVLNTDNSWVELQLRTVDCNKNSAYCRAVDTALIEKDFEWKHWSKGDLKIFPVTLTERMEKTTSLCKHDAKRYSLFCPLKIFGFLSKHREVSTVDAVFFAVGAAIIGSAIATASVTLIVLCVLYFIALPTVGFGLALMRKRRR